MIELKNLKLKNFFSHRNSEIDISSKRGLILIDGVNSDGRYDSNGSGKSTILEGIVYALSGNTLRNVGVNDVVNRTSGKDTHVSLEFSTNTDTYVVDRYRKDSIKGDKLEVSSTQGILSKRLNKDTQSVLEGILDIPYDVLVNTILLGEGLSSRFTQLSDSDKKSLIESTLNLSYDLNRSRDVANTKLKDLRLQKATLEGQILTLNSLLSEDTSTDDYANSVNLLQEYSAELKSIESNLASHRSELPNIQYRINLLTDTINNFNSLTAEIQRMDNENAHYVNEITCIESSESPVCGLCQQVLATTTSKESVINNFREKISMNEKELLRCRDSLKNMPAIDILRDNLQKYVDSHQEMATLIQELSSRESALKIQIATLHRDIEHMNSIRDNRESYRRQFIEKNTELESLSISISDYEYFYKLYSPTGIMTVVLEEAISYINTRMNVYTEILLDKSYNLSLEKGKISLKDPSGASYQSLSNGEKRRLDLCIQFSLHDYTHIYCGSSIDSLFLDEVLDTLDATGVNNIIEVLRLKMDYCHLSRILVISHNSALKSYFDEIITVRKDRDGNSSVD